MEGKKRMSNEHREHRMMGRIHDGNPFFLLFLIDISWCTVYSIFHFSFPPFIHFFPPLVIILIIIIFSWLTCSLFSSLTWWKGFFGVDFSSSLSILITSWSTSCCPDQWTLTKNIIHKTHNINRMREWDVRRMDEEERAGGMWGERKSLNIINHLFSFFVTITIRFHAWYKKHLQWFDRHFSLFLVTQQEIEWGEEDDTSCSEVKGRRGVDRRKQEVMKTDEVE